MEELKKNCLTLEDLVPDFNMDVYDPKEDAIVSHKIKDFS